MILCMKQVYSVLFYVSTKEVKDIEIRLLAVQCFDELVKL